MLWLSGLTLACAAVLGSGGSAGAGKDSPVSSTGRLSLMDARFVQAATLGDMMEIDLGQLAGEKATRADIKAYAARLVEDHSKRSVELRKLAAEKGVSLPAMLPFPGDRNGRTPNAPNAARGDSNAPGAVADPERAGGRADLARLGLRHMVVKHQETRRLLSTMSGEAFDKAFIGSQFIEHSKMAAAFELKSMEAQDPDVRKYAAKVLPMIQEHRESARRLVGLGPQMRTADRR